MSRCSSPSPARFRLWSDTLVRALFEDPARADAARHLQQLGGSPSWGRISRDSARVRAVEDQDWERVWLTDWKSMRFGRRLWVCPTAAERRDDPDAVVVRLDPGLAFGTGTHPTTALCLQMLDSLPLAGPHGDRLRLRLGDPGHRRAEARRGAGDRGGHRSAGADRDARQCGAQRRRRVAASSVQDVAGAALPPACCVVAKFSPGR